jgi:hypothetical protein
MALINLTVEQCKWIVKCYWKAENVECPPRSPDLTPAYFFLWGVLKNAIYTSAPLLRPETWNSNCMCCCSISNNTERLTICWTSTMHCCLWWTFWTFVTLNVKISQFYLCLYVNEHSKCVYVLVYMRKLHSYIYSVSLSVAAHVCPWWAQLCA